jgi:hypothetical protein
MNTQQRTEVVLTLADHARSAAGESAVVDVSSTDGGDVDSLEITPVRTGAARVSVVAERWILVQVGDAGSGFEFAYTPKDIERAHEVITAAIAGRVRERRGLGRSALTVTVSDGSDYTAVWYDSRLSALIPQPGWQKRGRLRTYLPYR